MQNLYILDITHFHPIQFETMVNPELRARIIQASNTIPSDKFDAAWIELITRLVVYGKPHHDTVLLCTVATYGQLWGSESALQLLLSLHMPPSLEAVLEKEGNIILRKFGNEHIHAVKDFTDKSTMDGARAYQYWAGKVLATVLEMFSDSCETQTEVMHKALNAYLNPLHDLESRGVAEINHLQTCAHPNATHTERIAVRIWLRDILVCISGRYRQYNFTNYCLLVLLRVLLIHGREEDRACVLQTLRQALRILNAGATDAMVGMSLPVLFMRPLLPYIVISAKKENAEYYAVLRRLFDACDLMRNVKDTFRLADYMKTLDEFVRSTYTSIFDMLEALQFSQDIWDGLVEKSSAYDETSGLAHLEAWIKLFRDTGDETENMDVPNFAPYPRKDTMPRDKNKLTFVV